MNSTEFYKLHDRIQKILSRPKYERTSAQQTWLDQNIEYYQFLKLFPQNQALLQNRQNTKTTSTVPQPLSSAQQAEKLELERKLKYAEKLVAQAEKFLPKTSPDRSAGNWSNLDYEDIVANLQRWKSYIEKYKNQLAKYENN